MGSCGSLAVYNSMREATPEIHTADFVSERPDDSCLALSMNKPGTARVGGKPSISNGKQTQTERGSSGAHRFLAAAIGKIGGIPQAAKVLKAPEETVYAWLETGLAAAPFDKVCKLGWETGISLGYFASRP